MVRSRSVKRRIGTYWGWLLVWGQVSIVQGQPPVEASPDEPPPEAVDPTRLDVERLPVEAIDITRDLYAHGLFLEGWVGVRAFQGGLGRFSGPGAFANVGLGLEVTRWLLVRAAVEGSVHGTDAPAPPTPTVFEILGAWAEARLQLNLSARVALWAGGEVGVVAAAGDALEAYGFDQSQDLGIAYGGTAGLDWHLFNRHYSLGLLGGYRLYPSLDAFDDEGTTAIHSALYLRYVF